MKKSNKIINIAVCSMGLITIVAFSGCKKGFLDRQPLGQYTTGNYPYPQGGGPYDQYIFAAYSSLRSYNTSAFPYIGAVDIRADDDDKGSTPSDGPEQIQMDNFPVMPTNSLVNSLWTGYYSNINYCNIILHQTGIDSPAASEPVRMQAEAEARFLRGYFYFMLVRLFGNVPIIDTVSSNVSAANIPQSMPAQVYAFIEQDLQFAAANLPLTWPAKFVGRATSGAAHGMLAKVYLYEQKWQQAMDQADMVINSGIYNLNTPYDEIFTEQGKNCSGSVFEIQCFANATNPTAFGSQYAQMQGVRGTDWANLGWGFNNPSMQLVNAYEPGDPREASTILYCPSKEPTRYGEIFPAEPDSMYNMKVYTNPATRATVGSQGYWVNIRILRYSDILLMYAEAANELGQTDDALGALEQVRSRARDGNPNVLPMVTTRNQDSLRQAIWHERRIELAMEGQRFFDIVRWGIADSSEHADGKMNFIGSRDDLLPIPQQQIDISKGTLKQNPGY